MTPVVRWAGLLLAASMFALSGCASAPKSAVPVDAVNGPWSGRLALQVERPAQSFSAGFELKGSAQTGELALLSPLGGTLALLSWQPGKAMLQANGEVRDFESIDALLAHVAGAAIPVGALFDWLRGVDTPVPGWRADLSQLGQGRVTARRTEPLPVADLRVVLER